MKKTYRNLLAFTLVLSASMLAGGCGCGKKKEPDVQSQQVMKITITPSVAPTKSPDEINPDAVVTNGNMTMVNEYLEQKTSGSSQADDPADSETGTDSGEDSDEAGDEGGGE